MANLNTVTVLANLTADPELRFTQSGRAVASLSLAINRNTFDRATQERRQSVTFIDGTVWGELAEHVAQSLSLGTRVLVVGRLEQRSWVTEDGEKRSKIQIVADQVTPSLEYATVEVLKIAKSETTPEPLPEAPSQPKRTEKARADTRRPAAPTPSPYEDEEPF